METLELIDQYLDRQLPAEQAQQLERMLRQDADLQRLFDSVVVAREAIRSSALRARISRLHGVYMSELEAEDRPDNVIPMHRGQPFRWAYRAAASLLLGVMTYSAYQVTALDSGQYYGDKFIPYRLPVTRGNAVGTTPIDSLYLNGSYAAVTKQFATLVTKQPRDYFLTGMAYLQRHEFGPAIQTLTALRRYNAQNATSYFVQETDYYLALAYLGANRVEDAYALFKTIHDTPQHLYSKTVGDRDLLKLRILLAKQ